MLNALKSRLRRLIPTPPREAAPSPAGTSAARLSHDERVRLRLMRRELFRLLELHADSRRLMRHLALVERTLRKQGLAAVEALPRGVIAQALQQLEALVRDWSSDGLADMRSRMAVMLKHGDDAAEPLGANGPSTLGRGLLTCDDADASDSDHAAFAEMERSWAGRMPTEPAEQPRRSL